MRILHLVHNFPPEFAGGTEVVVLAHARALVGRGHEVTVLAGTEKRAEGLDSYRDDFEGMAVIRLPRREGEDYGVDVTRPRVRGVVEKTLRSLGPDVVHVHHWATLTSDLVRTAAAEGRPVVVTLHDLWTTCPRFFRTPIPGVVCPEDESRRPCIRCVGKESGLDEPALRRLFAARDDAAAAELNAASALLAPSRAHAAKLKGLLPRVRQTIRVIPHGLLTGPGPRSQPREGAPFRIGSFGNFTSAKGTHLLLEALRGSRLRDRVEVRLDGRFVEAGYEERLRGGGDRLPVSFGGAFLPERALATAARLDLAVFPSLCEESYGLVVDEAFAAGVPVVVSDRGALPERVGEGGLVVRSGDLGALRRAIESFVEDPLLRARLRAGVPKRLRTAADAAADLEEVYREALRGEGKPR